MKIILYSKLFLKYELKRLDSCIYCKDLKGLENPQNGSHLMHASICFDKCLLLIDTLGRSCSFMQINKYFWSLVLLPTIIELASSEKPQNWLAKQFWHVLCMRLFCHAFLPKEFIDFLKILLIFSACTLSSSDNRQFFPDILYFDPDLAVHLLLFIKK